MVNTKKALLMSFLLLCLLLNISTRILRAQPYGVGKYNALVPYGGQTTLSITTSGTVSMTVTPSSTSGTLSTTASDTVTVTSTDVVGYKLYIAANGSTSLSGTAGSIAASSNISEAALSVNTWGYNTDNSGTYIGLTGSNVLINSKTGPFESGDTTTVNYAADVDYSISPGSYSSNVIYTVVPQTT